VIRKLRSSESPTAVVPTLESVERHEVRDARQLAWYERLVAPKIDLRSGERPTPTNHEEQHVRFERECVEDPFEDKLSARRLVRLLGESVAQQ
jgi:hypothetical protein